MKQENSGIVREVTNCRICGCTDLVKYLDLGSLPLANNLAATASDAKAMRRYPMQVPRISALAAANILFRYRPLKS